MKQIVVISGKGGTGKTTLTAAISTIAKNKVIADCDVDAPDLHLILNPKVKKTMVFHGLKLAVIDNKKCIRCMRCYKSCRFDAINEDLDISKDKCEGCGVCEYVCPVNAVSMADRDTGYLYMAETRLGPFSYGILKTAEEASGKLVSAVRENAKDIAEEKGLDTIIIDGPPGIGCPVIASITGVDLALIVVEPTKSGIHDMERVLKVTRHFNVRAVVCINKYDISPEYTTRIEEYCKNEGVEIVGKIPFDEDIVRAMVEGKSIIEFNRDSDTSKRISGMWNKIKDMMGE
ncbi:MAG TPA: 4Fe-4S dicluster domain-containing protein [Thermoplasmatales archaeon]|nr:4Fe-4S dicluster domain-containing protein [Thermoplasmatales archaeon]